MKRIIRISLKFKFRLLAIIMVLFFIGSNAILLGNSLINDKDLKPGKEKSQIATNFDFLVENINNEPERITKGLVETEKVFGSVKEEDNLSANRTALEFNEVTFFVFNQDGMALPEALIQLSEGSSAITDEFGFAAFTLLNDVYQAEISKPNHETIILEFEVIDGDELFLEVLLIEVSPNPLEINCPPDLSLPTNEMCFAFNVDLGEPIVIDSSPGYVVTNDSPADGFPVGTTVVIWTVENEWGETASCDQLVTVDDVEPPTVTPVSDITIDNESGECGSSVSWESPTASDNCDEVTLESSHVPGDFFPVGSTSVIYTATDVHGNSAYAGFTVEVIDVEPPTLSTINDIVINVDPGQCSAIVEYDFPEVTENCPDVILTLEEGLVSGSAFPAGVTTVRVRAVDDAGNVADSFFSVTVNDNEPPNISPVSDITIDSEAGECGGSASWELPATSDNCEDVTLEGSHAPGDFFPAGSTSVIYTATDVHGNSAYAGFTVEVIDIEPPNITPLLDITIDSEAGECGGIASWEPPATSDNCEDVTLEGSHAPGDFFPAGSTSVIYTATDVFGNAAYSGFTVEVIDVEPPTAICQNITIQLDESGAASVDGVDIDDGSSDACGIASLAIDNSEFDCADVGDNVVTLTVSDNNGNQSTCPATVTVQESIICLDCAGVVNGTASIDECGICSGGDTGLIPNESCTDCEGVVNGDALPGTICFGEGGQGFYDDDCNCDTEILGSIDGHVDWLQACGTRNIFIETYNFEFPELGQAFATTLDEFGDFTSPAFSTGTYDILVTVEGYLSNLYTNIEIVSGTNQLDISGIIAGDLNASNGVNISDFSILNNAFGSIDGDDNYNNLADFNCDGSVNIIDISILNISFGMIGDSLPSNN